LDYVRYLPHINATLNGISAILLIVGFILIKRGNVTAHKWTMLSCFGVSTVFLICYLTYHIAIGGSRRFPETAPSTVRIVYLSILASHAILAAFVPFLAMITIYLGLRDRRASHRKWAKWTFPIWLYVSITGVIVYWMLYQLYA
jgi:putative membrane protein